MKIIAVHGFLDKFRGAELTFVNMLKYLRKRGYEIDVLVFGISSYYRNQLQEEGIGIRLIEFKEVFFTKPFSLLNTCLRVINMMRAAYIYWRFSTNIDKEYELAFIHHYNYSPLALPFLRTTKVYYCHEPPRSLYEPDRDKKPILLSIANCIKNYIPRIIEKRLDKYCVKCADIILSNSDYSRDYIQQIYSIRPITNYLGVDLSIFKPLGLKKEHLVVSVGAINDKKAHDFVITSIGLMPTEKRPRLVIIGDGPQESKNKLCSLAAQKEISLDIKSNISTEEVVEVYNKAKVATIAYIKEPSIEPEALACGTPVVAVDEGGVREAINNEVGILTNRDEGEFSKAITYLLENPKIAEQMGKRGIELVERRYTWEKCVENLETNFNKAISIGKQKRR